MKSYLNKHLSALLVLLVLSASVLSASHVHADEYLDLDSDQIEQCLAYHVADHQQSSHIPSFDFSKDASHQHQIFAQQSSGLHQHITPPARAPPHHV